MTVAADLEEGEVGGCERQAVSLQYRFGLLPACLLTTRTTSATSIHTYICDDGAVKWTSDDHTRVRTPGRVPYVNTVDNLADFFTKALSTKNFYRMRDLIMNVSPAQNGGVPSVPVGVPSSTGGQYSPIGSPTGGC